VDPGIEPSVPFDGLVGHSLHLAEMTGIGDHGSGFAPLTPDFFDQRI
jgi:hypothetical protein